ncbi:unnamed protein product, partial [Heterosigma akashiwo]
VCSICLGEETVGQVLTTVFCGHRFHDGCLEGWLAAHHRCPLCQRDLNAPPPAAAASQENVNRTSWNSFRTEMAPAALIGME